MISKAKTMIALEQMYQMFPDAHGELISKNPFELLIAVILSAQATDVSVNKVTPHYLLPIRHLRPWQQLLLRKSLRKYGRSVFIATKQKYQGLCVPAYRTIQWPST